MSQNVALFPDSLLRDLGFDKVLEICSQNAVGTDARNSILHQDIFKDQKLISELVETIYQIQEWNHHARINIREYANIEPALKNLKIENFQLPIEEIIAIRIVLENIQSIHSTIKQKEWMHLNLLQLKADEISDLAFLIKIIQKIISPDGTIPDDASSELKLIRKNLATRQNEVYKVFKKLVTQFKNADILAEGGESIRNGRLVLRVHQEHRRKVEGIIHDESDKGRTIFIEPKELVEINNEIFELEYEERKEIQKILRALCASMRPHTEAIHQNFQALVDWDILIAKARFCETLEAQVPEFNLNGDYHLIQSRHPLLFLKLQTEHKHIIPNDLHMKSDKRILLISGPNAGGKTVLLKTVGLLQCMFQAGLPIPLSKKSKLIIFDKIFGDIGDHQSLEDDLSTYSARLKIMRQIELHAHEKSLVLMDELGSGTDPTIGGAIAEALLVSLTQKKCYAVINTHYSNLKIFAHQHFGIQNAAMVFDEKKLLPTYRLHIGRPGGSFAIEIAEKIQLPKNLIQYAKKKAGQQHIQFESLLTGLDAENQKLQKQIKEYQEKKNELDKLIRTYQDLHKQNEFKKLKLKLEQRQMDLQLSMSKQKEIEKYSRELRKEKDLERLIQKAELEKNKVKEQTESVLKTHEELHLQSENKESNQIKIGDSVKLLLTGMTGKVIKIQKDIYTVSTEHMTFKIKKKELVKIKSDVPVKPERSIKSDLEISGKPFQPVLDLRGLRLQEAEQMMEQFIDKALLSNVNRVHIVHGKGSGALKQTVTKHLRHQKFVKQLLHPEEELGGESITIVEFQ